MKTIQSLLLAILFLCCASLNAQNIDLLKKGFKTPPDSAKPGVYWYFMDGNLTKESLTKDLESMKQAGIGNLMYLEVNVGVPRGNVDFFSEEWQQLFTHAVKEAERLDIEISMGLGPGWTGSGGPWVKPEESMQHIVGESVAVKGGKKTDIILPVPAPKRPYFGLPAEMQEQWSGYYEDIAVIAFPKKDTIGLIGDIDEKALYYRPPYTSVAGVKPYFVSGIASSALKEKGIDPQEIIDLTDKMDQNGRLQWNAPKGEWTVMRFVSRNNGASTRPAPLPGLGFESDKFDKGALNRHLDHFIGSLLEKTGIPDKNAQGGLKRLHMDSWEMGAQNWSKHFREEFKKRRGYDPFPFYPVFSGLIVKEREISERFLWDLRLTSQELVIENHAEEGKRYARERNMGFSIEPYDMNPTADMELGAVADLPMCEFWSKGFGFNSAFSCIEATSIGHINGSSIIAAEAFTADPGEGWKQYPGVMKNQGDWAFATGINRFVYHTFQNQFLDDSLKPGATMGPYGVHWDRSQTWWPMVNGYHDYVSRCQYILQQGKHVADILFLTPEGAPHVFKPPFSAMTASDTIPDRKGYNFDGIAPGQLYRATVENNRIVFPGGASYRILVLPSVETMTPGLLHKIKSLINDGAHIIGIPPLQSPSLAGYPDCDREVKETARAIWRSVNLPAELSTVHYGKGKITWGKAIAQETDNLYPQYDIIAKTLRETGVTEDFKSDREEIRYAHRTDPEWDIYFLSNKTGSPVTAHCNFRVDNGNAMLWDPITGNIYGIDDITGDHHTTSMMLEFEPYQSFFIVFDKKSNPDNYGSFLNAESIVTTLNGQWNVSFDPAFGGPAHIQFDSLTDWTHHHLDGVRYYSGIATYTTEFDLPTETTDQFQKYYIDLGDVKNLAQVKINGKDAGILWTYPWKLDITPWVKSKNNLLEVKVANLWVNRLIGDEKLPYDGIQHGQWPDWIVDKEKRPSERYTFTTYRHYSAESPLQPSGLLGPVTIKGIESAPEKEKSMVYIQNDRLKLGIDTSLGGAVTYLSDNANGGENMINSYDWGRQIQMSYYSGPWPYIGPKGERPTPEWEGLGWNPIQSGDAGGNRSKVISCEKRGNNAILVRSIPMQWPHKTGVAGECVFETLYTLKDNVITMEATIVNNRKDKTQYPACGQEMPAVYTNGSWYKLVAYLGDQPFTDAPPTVIVDKNNKKGWPWVHFYTPENWVALMDDNGYGIGVFQPEVMTFNGGFHPNDHFKGHGAEKDVQTGHIAPVGRQIIDHNIRWTYKTSLILGTLDDIRAYAKENSTVTPNPNWDFKNSRQNWVYHGDIKDTGSPIKGGLDLIFNKDAAIVSPATFWQADKNPVLEIEGKFSAKNSKELELVITLHPVSESDFTDWLNWSEGEFNAEEEWEKKGSLFPLKPAITVTQKIVADGRTQKHRIDLSSIPGYQSAMKSIRISFSEKGKAKISKIYFGK